MPATATLRNSIAQRRYRLAQAITIAGAIAIGSLVVNRLVELFRDDFLLYYGVTGEQYDRMRDTADNALPLTLGTFSIAVIALVSVCAFVWSEQRRINQRLSLQQASRGARSSIVVEKLSVTTMFDQFVTRTSSFAGLLLSIWLLQTSVERWLSGYGLGIEYVDWRSLLPFASVFGLCVLAGMLVAALSLVGMRAIHVLERALGQILTRRTRRTSSVRVSHHERRSAFRTLRDLLGYEILTRPPPVAA